MGKITRITLFIASLLALQSCIPFHSNLPNIIYIYADDLGYGELGCYGQDKISTPYLDRLASDGMRFTQHYTGAPVCAPARCMLMTGQHAGHSYIRGNYELGERQKEPSRTLGNLQSGNGSVREPRCGRRTSGTGRTIQYHSAKRAPECPHKRMGVHQTLLQKSVTCPLPE